MKRLFVQLLITGGVCALVFAGYGVWYATIAAKSTVVTDLQNQIDTKTETMSRMAAVRATFAEIASDEAVVQGYFVPETGVVAFIDRMESVGRSLGTVVSVLSVSTGGTAAQPTLALALSIQGTFDAVMRTAGAIEYAPHAVTISNLLMNRVDKGAWRADLKILVRSVPAGTVKSSP